MQFDKENKVKIETMSHEEAQCYIRFLKEEEQRHRKEIDRLQSYIGMLTLHPMREFYQSAVKRHETDIKGIQPIVAKVRRMFNA